MRWERLWSDLEAQAAALERDDFDAEVADRSVRETATVSLMDRVRGSVASPLSCEVVGGRAWRGTLVGHGPDWLALRQQDPTRAQVVLLPTQALEGVSGLGPTAVPAEAMGLVAARVDLRLVLRRLAATDPQVTLDRPSSSSVVGRIGRVGRDYVEVRGDDGVLAVPWSAVAAVTAT